jgi:hypothetical protein
MKALVFLLFITAASIKAKPPNKFELNSERVQRVVEQGRGDLHTFALLKATRLYRARTARVIGGLDSSDIFCNSEYKHFLA